MHAGEQAEIEILRRTAERLRTAGHGAKDSIVAEATRWLGCSVPTLYRRLRTLGWKSGRSERADKGDSKVPFDQLVALSTMWSDAGAKRLNGRWVRTIDDVISIARANGVLTVDVSGSTLLRLFRIHGLHRQQVSQPEPNVQMRSLHPNHVWQIDPSLCVVYYSQRDGLRVLDERKYYKNKPDYVAKFTPLRVWRYVAVDHYSGAVYARYFEAAGENQETLFEFLMDAFEPSDARHIMRGVPHALVWDPGSANTAYGVQALLTALLVRHWPHIPGNPRAKGSVEKANHLIEQHFEGRLPFCKVPTVEQLNKLLADWLVAWNANRVHSRHGHTRYGMWQTISQQQLRIRPELDTCRAMLTSRPETRKVRSDLTIQFAPKGHASASYSVDHVPGVMVGDQVQVVVHAYRAPAICVMQRDEDHRTTFFECEPVTPITLDTAGFDASAPVFGERFARKADTPADEARKAQAEIAYGTRDLAEAQKLRAKGTPAFGGEIDPFKDVREAAAQAPSHMTRKGSELHLANPVQVELRPLTLVEALKTLREWLGRPISPEERARMEEWYPNNAVPETDIPALAERITRDQERRSRLTLVQ